jgi:predicted ABC-type ATPase
MLKRKRIRIFAGPNGSGKSSVFEELSKKYPTGVYINSDNIEKELRNKRFIDLSDYSLNASSDDLNQFKLLPTTASLLKKGEKEKASIDIFVKENCLVNPNNVSNSYEAAFCSMFLRWLCSNSGISFTFETVMSHPSKLSEIEEYKKMGFKIYLYFVCIDDPDINIERVAIRTEKGGHPVPEEKIRKRYFETLSTIQDAIPLVDNLYFIDNSKKQIVVAEKIGSDMEILVNNPPNWFMTAILPLFETK